MQNVTHFNPAVTLPKKQPTPATASRTPAIITLPSSAEKLASASAAAFPDPVGPDAKVSRKAIVTPVPQSVSKQVPLGPPTPNQLKSRQQLELLASRLDAATKDLEANVHQLSSSDSFLRPFPAFVAHLKKILVDNIPDYPTTPPSCLAILEEIQAKQISEINRFIKLKETFDVFANPEEAQIKLDEAGVILKQLKSFIKDRRKKYSEFILPHAKYLAFEITTHKNSKHLLNPFVIESLKYLFSKIITKEEIDSAVVVRKAIFEDNISNYKKLLDLFYASNERSISLSTDHVPALETHLVINQIRKINTAYSLTQENLIKLQNCIDEAEAPSLLDESQGPPRVKSAQLACITVDAASLKEQLERLDGQRLALQATVKERLDKLNQSIENPLDKSQLHHSFLSNLIKVTDFPESQQEMISESAEGEVAVPENLLLGIEQTLHQSEPEFQLKLDELKLKIKANHTALRQKLVTEWNELNVNIHQSNIKLATMSKLSELKPQLKTIIADFCKTKIALISFAKSDSDLLVGEANSTLNSNLARIKSVTSGVTAKDSGYSQNSDKTAIVTLYKRFVSAPLVDNSGMLSANLLHFDQGSLDGSVALAKTVSESLSQFQQDKLKEIETLYANYNKLELTLSGIALTESNTEKCLRKLIEGQTKAKTEAEKVQAEVESWDLLEELKTTTYEDEEATDPLLIESAAAAPSGFFASLKYRLLPQGNH